jgi:CBS domain containing-hemolysin-like protein
MPASSASDSVPRSTPRIGNDDGATAKPHSSSWFSRIQDAIFPSRKSKRNGNGEASWRDTLEELAEESEADGEAVSIHERMLLENLVALRDLTAYDVRVPRADIVAVQKDIGLDELIALMLEKAHSRLPVFDETLDDCIGMVHIKDVLAYAGGSGCDDGQPFDLNAILRKILFVSPAMRVLDLMLEMRVSRTHMALVVDEYGGIDGLITIEDLVEQIVGEIEDEHDVDDRPEFTRQEDGSYLADARVRLEDFADEFGGAPWEEEEDGFEDIDTLGGLVFTLADRIPYRGELIAYPDAGLQFEAVDVEPRRIRRLRVRRISDTPADQISPEEDAAKSDGDS